MSLDTIKTLVDELTTLHITRGVQPGDLADNIFEDSYVTSSSRKTPTGAQFEMTFQEVDEDDQVSQVTMRYTYDQSRYLLLVEQKVSGKRFVVQWDRAACIQKKSINSKCCWVPSCPRRESKRSSPPSPVTS